MKNQKKFINLRIIMRTTPYAPIRITGDPVLYQRAAVVTEFDNQLAELAQRLMATMESALGVGIAAPQIGVSLRLFILASRPNARYPDAPSMTPLLMVNPQLIQGSAELVWGEEGCLSVPGRRVQIARHQEIDVSFQTLTGENRQATLAGFVARIFQHELDHLNGITLLERLAMPPQEGLAT
ncbi:MAG: peptide deformylase [Plesiomonas shigelloides]